jgi:crotonobetainyl-CoA:carnitine CoA-transferase CaiB-like acyl-CoA transferase
VLGYGPDEYYGTGSFYADPVTGIHGAVGVLAALFHVKRTGRGQWLDMSLLENVAPYLAQPLLEYSITGMVPEPRGNRSAVYAPQGVYRSAGTDCWLAITVRNETDWKKLCATIDRPDLADNPRMASTEGRRALHDEIDEAIEAWSRTLDQVTAAERLQANGVPAAPVMPNWQITSDNHLHDRGFFVDVRHPVAGTHRFPGFPWKLEKTPAKIRMHAPMFAEHNQAVFGELLGMSKAEIDELYESGATGDEPIYQVTLA